MKSATDLTLPFIMTERGEGRECLLFGDFLEGDALAPESMAVAFPTDAEQQHRRREEEEAARDQRALPHRLLLRVSLFPSLEMRV